MVVQNLKNVVYALQTHVQCCFKFKRHLKGVRLKCFYEGVSRIDKVNSFVLFATIVETGYNRL